jgi:hypothetical protein
MKCQTFTLLDEVKVYVPVYKINPWIRLGHAELPSAEETNAYIISQIGNEIAEVIKESVRGKLNQAYARLRVKKALNGIGYWPNPKLPDKLRDERSDSWINGMINTSVASAQNFRTWM